MESLSSYILIKPNIMIIPINIKNNHIKEYEMNYNTNLDITLDLKSVPNIEVVCYSCSIDPPKFDAQHHKKVIAHFLFFFMSINYTFNFLDRCVPHVMHQMKSVSMSVTLIMS